MLGGWFWLPSGVTLAPGLRGCAVEAGEELMCREKAPFLLWFDPIWHVVARAVASA